MSNTDSSRTFLHDRGWGAGGGRRGLREQVWVWVVCTNAGCVCVRGRGVGGGQSDKPLTNNTKTKRCTKPIGVSSSFSTDSERCWTKTCQCVCVWLALRRFVDFPIPAAVTEDCGVFQSKYIMAIESRYWSFILKVFENLTNAILLKVVLIMTIFLSLILLHMKRQAGYNDDMALLLL